jgi:hypothetical protein
MTEVVTVTCTRHRRRVVNGSVKGSGIVILHAGPGGNVDPVCDSERFTVRREQEASRGTAHAELDRLDCLAQAQAALSAPETDSAAAAATREDEGS